MSCATEAVFIIEFPVSIRFIFVTFPATEDICQIIAEEAVLCLLLHAPVVTHVALRFSVIPEFTF